MAAIGGPGWRHGLDIDWTPRAQQGPGPRQPRRVMTDMVVRGTGDQFQRAYILVKAPRIASYVGRAVRSWDVRTVASLEVTR